MRVDLTPQRLELTPGFTHSVILTVTNTESIIAGFGIRVLGADPGWIQLPTEHLSLFPDEARNVEIVIDPPRGMPAGSRRLAVQVRELTEPYASTITEIDLVVPALPQTQLRVDPMVVTAGKRATYSLLVENTGNTDLTGYLSGDDPESKVGFTFEPERIVLAPGQHAVVDMQATAKRPFFGSPTVRSLSLYLDPRPHDALFTELAAQQATAEEREPVSSATFIQKSVMARGALSLIGLLFAATVFAIVITLALSKLVAQSTADRNLALQVAAAKDGGAATSGSSGVAGTVRLLTSGTPVPGVAVSVFDESDTSVAIATTATDDKGAYSVTDLAAGKYKLSFRGAGFVQLWYPAAATDADATTVSVDANQVKAGLNVSLGGVPASISGTVTGDDVGAATLFLEQPASGTTPNVARAAPLTDPTTPVAPPDNGAAVVQQVPIGSDGSFSLTNVPSPSIYDLVVVKQGYATSTQRIDVGAGETRKGVQLTLVKGDGLISGTVATGSGGGLGGVTITATSGQSTASTVSLTGAKAGTFTLRNLATPASYTLIVSLGGFASQTLSLSLSAGQQLVGVDVTLSKSSATLTGKVLRLPDNTPIGGVSVSITNGQLTLQTVTESTDDIGAWSIAGLAVPGTYTATFSRSDLQSQTVSVSLDAGGNVTPGSLGARVSSDGLVVSMQSATASLHGVIKQPFGARVCNKSTSALGEAMVSLSSGGSTYSVVSASVSPHCGEYRLENIPPGSYTLTATSSSGTTPQSTVVTVEAGQDLAQNITLSRPASIRGTITCATPTSTPVGRCQGEPGPRGGWTVFLYARADYPNTVTATATTAADGTYVFTDVDAGSYVLAAGPTRDAANATNTTTTTVQPSQQRAGVDIRVSQ